MLRYVYCEQRQLPDIIIKGVYEENERVHIGGYVKKRPRYFKKVSFIEEPPRIHDEFSFDEPSD